MSKKVSTGGESYIVSEDVDFDSLDIESMVQKDESIPTILQQPKPEEKYKNLNVGGDVNVYSRPTIEFRLKAANKQYTAKGFFSSVEVNGSISTYKVMMPFKDAIHINQIMLKSQGNSGSQRKRILYLGSTIFCNGKKVDFKPLNNKNGKTSQKLDRVKIKFRPVKGYINTAFVEFDFVSIHWR